MKAKLLIFLLILALTAPVFGQQAKPEEKGVKLALINSAFFDDKDNGIADYVRAFRILDGEIYSFGDTGRLKNQIEILEKQLQNPSLTLLERRLKEQELNARKIEYERIKKYQDETIEWRYNILIKPIQDDIKREIDKIGKQNNIVFIDASKDDKAVLLWADMETVDLTKQFVDYYNNRKQTNADFVVKTEIPEIRIVQINRRLLDNKNDNLNRVIAEYAKEKGFVFIFDSTIPFATLESTRVPDITDEFIAYFNERYP